MADWRFLTKHAQALLYIAGEPDTRLRSIATALDVTERTAHAIIADLAEAGYVVKEKDGRRNRYHIQMHVLLHDLTAHERTIGEMVKLLADIGDRDT